MPVTGQFAIALVTVVVRKDILGVGVVSNLPQSIKDNVLPLTGDFNPIIVALPEAVGYSVGGFRPRRSQIRPQPRKIPAHLPRCGTQQSLLPDQRCTVRDRNGG